MQCAQAGISQGCNKQYFDQVDTPLSSRPLSEIKKQNKQYGNIRTSSIWQNLYALTETVDANIKGRQVQL